MFVLGNDDDFNRNVLISLLIWLEVVIYSFEIAHRPINAVSNALQPLAETGGRIEGFSGCSTCNPSIISRLKSPASRLLAPPFIQAQIKENFKPPRHWPLTGEYPAQMASNAENIYIWWRHHDMKKIIVCHYLFVHMFSSMPQIQLFMVLQINCKGVHNSMVASCYKSHPSNMAIL